MNGWQSGIDRMKKASDPSGAESGWGVAVLSVELMAPDCVAHASNLLVRKLDDFSGWAGSHFLFQPVSPAELPDRAEPPPRSADRSRVHFQEVVLGGAGCLRSSLPRRSTTPPGLPWQHSQTPEPPWTWRLELNELELSAPPPMNAGKLELQLRRKPWLTSEMMVGGGKSAVQESDGSPPAER